MHILFYENEPFLNNHEWSNSPSPSTVDICMYFSFMRLHHFRFTLESVFTDLITLLKEGVHSKNFVCWCLLAYLIPGTSSRITCLSISQIMSLGISSIEVTCTFCFFIRFHFLFIHFHDNLHIHWIFNNKMENIIYFDLMPFLKCQWSLVHLFMNAFSQNNRCTNATLFFTTLFTIHYSLFSILIDVLTCLKLCERHVSQKPFYLPITQTAWPTN